MIVYEIDDNLFSQHWWQQVLCHHRMSTLLFVKNSLSVIHVANIAWNLGYPYSCMTDFHPNCFVASIAHLSAIFIFPLEYFSSVDCFLFACAFFVCMLYANVCCVYRCNRLENSEQWSNYKHSAHFHNDDSYSTFRSHLRGEMTEVPVRFNV